MGKYAPLRIHLARGPDEQEYSFGDVESILGSPLPRSALVHPEWWSNDSVQHVQSKNGWLAAGFKTTAVDIRVRHVAFRRTGPVKDGAPTELVVEPRRQDVLAWRPDSAKRLENIGMIYLSHLFGTNLLPGEVPGVPKLFDFVSKDKTIVGDAKYLSLVNGVSTPPAKFANIAEHVWLLQNTKARHKILLFGNQVEVPNRWLARYGHLAGDVTFLFMEQTGSVTHLAGPEMPVEPAWGDELRRL